MASASSTESPVSTDNLQKESDKPVNSSEMGDSAAAGEPRVANKPTSGFNPLVGGPEKGFYQHFMNPLMSKMEENVRKNNQLLDDIQKKLDQEREDNRRKKLSEHIPATIQGQGQELKTIIKHIEDLIVYENYELEDDKEETNKFIKARLKQLDENSEVAILSHSIGAFVSTLEPQHLRHFTSKIVNDVTTWLSRLFRFKDGHAYFHEEERDGLIRICRLALHQKYPKFATDGYEALYSRPPMFYVSAAAKPLLGQYICAQLGLPLSCLSTVPCSNQLGTVQKMDIDALVKMIEDDKTSGKTPVLLVAYAGTPVVGNTDNIQKLQTLCKQEEMWLHLEGNNLATLTMYSVPTEIVPAQSSDSMTLNLNGWLGLPAVPYVTLYKSGDANLVRTIGLMPANRFRLNCVPLWTCLQNLGHEGVVSRIRYSLDLAKMVHDFVQKLPSLVNVSKRRKPKVPDDKKDDSLSIKGLLSRAINALILFEIETPCAVFRYQPQLVVPEAASPDTEGEDNENQQNAVADPYFDALNIWLYETLRRDSPRVHITAVELDNIGVCIRFAPVESGQMFDTTKEDLDQFLSSLDRQVKILDATVDQRADFQDVVIAQDNLRLVDLPNWAGLGAVQYISEVWVDKLENLSDAGKNELNSLNINLVHQLKSADTAFSLGQTEEGMNCVRFGLITEETDLEELIALVYTTGKEVEESSKFLETMAEVVRQGIEKANEDLHKETQNKLQQEGVLRQVPLVGSLFNWISPPPQDPKNMKGRSFNLSSGKIESTESTYKYHMQVQEAATEPATHFKDGPLKLNLKPAKRRSHSRSHSNTSDSKEELNDDETTNISSEVIAESTESTEKSAEVAATE